MGEDLWVFGYGSLMWRPGFDYVEAREARLYGLHRAFCIYSHHWRGRPEKPGLVLGLDRGGSCRGVAFRVASGEADAVIAYLRAREQVTMVYRELYRDIRFLDGASARAVTYAVDRSHMQYAGALPLARQVALILQASGEGGPNIDYLEQTVAHLDELGLEDRAIARLLTAARAAQAHLE